ncbi:MAG: hypothetical protein ABL966_06200 [Acidimicrobiales bacterium]
MPVEVRPESFTMVFFDAAEIQALVEKLVAEIGLPQDLTVTIEVDETTPMGRARVASLDPLVITAESGALEDVKAPRQLSSDGAIDVLGKLLLSVRDRRDPDFGDPPGDDDLTLQESAAWEAYCVARLGRLGHPVQRQRRLYQFRNRHGFTDAADAAFDRLWTAEDLTWADITAASQGALAALPA